MRYLIAAGMLLGAIGPLAAQSYPNRPTTIVLTTPAGNPVDLAARFMGERVKEKTGQSWVIDNKPGAQGSIAAKAAAIAKPDGYTAFVCPSGALSANQFLQKTLNYDPNKDFQLVARLFKIDFALMINQEKTPVATVAELTAFLKAKPNKVSYGYFSASMQALGAQYVHLAGITASPTAYRNPQQMMGELEAGDFDFSFTSVDNAGRPNSKLRTLAIASENRSALFPNLPTQTEAGMGNALPLYAWFGFCFPAGTPDVAAKTLAPLLLEIAKSDGFRDFLKNMSAEPFPGDAADLEKTRNQSSKDWEYFVNLAKIQAE